jgi:large subunit ribosomal protein L29
MNAKDLRALTLTELVERQDALHKELFELRVRATTKELENTDLLRSRRRDLARIKMVMAEKNQGAESGAAK